MRNVSLLSIVGMSKCQSSIKLIQIFQTSMTAVYKCIECVLCVDAIAHFTENSNVHIGRNEQLQKYNGRYRVYC